jgi:hypothetical protein
MSTRIVASAAVQRRTCTSIISIRAIGAAPGRDLALAYAEAVGVDGLDYVRRTAGQGIISRRDRYPVVPKKHEALRTRARK